MGYWTDKPFSKPKKAATAKSEKVRVEKCPACGKGPRQCRCHDVGEVVKTRGRRVRTHDRRDDSGIVWCGVCGSRTHKGVCMNVKCSTRK